MKGIISILLAAVLAVSSLGQVQPTYETVYDTHKTGYALVSTPFETFTVKNFNLPVWAFTGSTLTAAKLPVAGLKISYSTKLAGKKSGGDVMGSASLAYMTVQGEKAGFKLFGGITF